MEKYEIREIMATLKELGRMIERLVAKLESKINKNKLD